MYHTISEFLDDWKTEADFTGRVLDALTDPSLAMAVPGDGRTIGKLAWHIVTTLREMLERTGLALAGCAAHDAPVPSSAAKIAADYRTAAQGVLERVRGDWTDASLPVEDDMYGMKWPRSMTLQVLVRHQIHHRGQLTVLMRHAGLRVPGVYGPAREEWAQFGMQAPE